MCRAEDQRKKDVAIVAPKGEQEMCVYVRGGEREREEVRVRSRWGIYLWDEGVEMDPKTRSTKCVYRDSIEVA